MAIQISGVSMGVITGGPSSLNLSDLHDVSIVSPQTAQYLRYNAGISEWQNAFLNSDLAGSQGVSITFNAGPNTTTIGLGAITPTSIATSGSVSGSNLSGTNTGDQTITLTGDITGSGTGSFVTTLANTAVTPGSYTYSSITVDSKGRITSASSGAAPTGTVTSVGISGANGIGVASSPITTSGTIALSLGAITPTSVAASGTIGGSNFSGSSSGANTGDQTITLTGGVTGSGTGSFATTVITNANLTGDVTSVGNATTYSATVPATKGGTAQSTYAAGDTLYASAVNTLSKLTIGSTGQILTVTGGMPVWATPATNGTVTTVSIVTANGVSGTVATPTTTPAITLSLGAITPTSVAAVGTISGSNFSGSSSGANTGDQTITLTNDVTGSGIGSFTTTLATVNASPQANTFRKITINGKGLTTATSAVVSSDIITSLGYTPVNVAGATMTGFLILNADPTAALGAVTKQYADSIAAGVNIHAPCETATTTALAASTYNNGTGGIGATLTANANGPIGTIGGYAITATGKRILVKDQASQIQNGIYDVTQLGVAGGGGSPWILTRSSDFDGTPTTEVEAGDLTFVQEGSNAGTQWVQLTVGTGINVGPPAYDFVIIGTDNIVFGQFAGSGTYTAGSGINISTNVISNTGVLSNVAGSGISVSGATGNVTVTNTGVTSVAGTANQITVSGATGGVTFSLPTAVTISGTMTAGTFSGSGASLTSIPNGALTNSSLTIGSTNIALGATSTTLTGLTSVTSTTFVGALTGNATTATSSTTATNIAGGLAGNIVYQSGVGATALLTTGISSQVLVSGTTPAWTNTPTLTGTNFTGIPNGGLTNSSLTLGSTSMALGSTTTTVAGLSSVTSTTFVGALTGNASSATNIAGGAVNQIPFQSASSTTTFNAGLTYTAGTNTLSVGTAAAGVVSAMTGQTLQISSDVSVTISTNGSSRLSIASTGAFTIGGGTGTAGQVLASTGNASSPVWSSTPTLTGTNFTGIPNAGLTNSSLTIGSTNIALGATSTTLAGLTSVTSTAFVGALTGASSLNVLKAGDTMTGQLLISTLGTSVPQLNVQRTTDTGAYSWIQLSRADGTRALELISNGTLAAYGIPASAVGINAQGANGFYLSTADTARLSISGTGVVTVNAPTSGTLATMTIATITGAASSVDITAPSSDTARLTLTGNGAAFSTALELYQIGSGQAAYLLNKATSSLNIGTSNAVAMTITSANNVSIGTPAPKTPYSSGAASALAVERAATYSTLSSYAYSTTATAGGLLVLGHSKSATLSTLTATAADDGLGFITFEGVNSSSALTAGAYIVGKQDAAGGATFIPGRLEFYTATAAAAPVERVRIDSVGKVTINEPSSGFALTATHPGQTGAIIRGSSSTGGANIRFYNDQNSAVRALEMNYTGSAYASGVITGAATGEAGSLATTGSFPLYIGTNNTARLTIASGGAATFSSSVDAVSFNATSTKRVKKAIKNITTAYLDKFADLRPREYDRRDYNAHEFGFIAEEMALVYPEVVGRDENGIPRSVDYGKLSTILTAKVQEQQKVINKLSDQVAKIMELLKGSK